MTAQKSTKNQETGIMDESKCDKSFPEQVLNWASEGLSDVQIAYRISMIPELPVFP